MIWRKSSYSGGENECVEVARTDARGLIRDSKNPDGPRLAVPDLAGFLAVARDGCLVSQHRFDQ